MEDFNVVLYRAVQEGIIEGVKEKFKGYLSPIQKIIDNAIEAHAISFQKMISDAILDSTNDESFRKLIIEEVRTKLGKILVQRFGGELEKQINALKSDPATRARITLAIEDIVIKLTKN